MEKQAAKRQRELSDLLKRDHTLNGGILFSLDGYIIEIQARAMSVLRSPTSVASATRISGMARGAMEEALDRTCGAFNKFGYAESDVEILINLAPAGHDRRRAARLPKKVRIFATR